MRSQWSYLLSVVCLLLFFLITKVAALGCFKCISENHNNPECEDTFNNTEQFWVPDCWATRIGRVGTFPGTQCIKIKVEEDVHGKSMVIRNCVVDNGGTNSETEIGRLSHCGWLRTIAFKGNHRRGCILACDTDGCNMAPLPVAASISFLSVLTVCALGRLLTGWASAL